MVQGEGAAPAVSVIGSALRTSPQLAALANGVASHALDFDFTFTQGQLMAPVIPALLPLAEQTGATSVRGAGGLHRRLRGLLAAVPRQPDAQRRRAPGTAPRPSARSARRSACARLMKTAGGGDPRRDRHRGVDGVGRQRQLRHHDQAAARRPRGAKRHDGGACSARRASARTTRRWKAAAVSSRRSRAALPGAPSRSTISAAATIWPRSGFRPKRYPCGGVIHTGIDAALQIRDELGPKVADITAIKAGISKYAASRAGAEYPANMEAAKFNLQYVVAASLANGVPKLATFEPDAIKDARVKALAGMVSVAIDPEFADATRGLSDADRGHAQGRPHRRAAGGLRQRHREEPDVARADAREVLRLRRACRGRAGSGGEDRGDARPARRSAVVRASSGRCFGAARARGLSAASRRSRDSSATAPGWNGMKVSAPRLLTLIEAAAGNAAFDLRRMPDQRGGQCAREALLHSAAGDNEIPHRERGDRLALAAIGVGRNLERREIAEQPPERGGFVRA